MLGDYFSSGLDLKDLVIKSESIGELDRILRQYQTLIMKMREVPLIIIGLVKGHSIAEGVQLIQNCDLAFGLTGTHH